MATELLQQKIANLRGQVDSYKLELYLLELQLADVPAEKPADSDEFNKAVYDQLFNESRNARARVMYLRRKVEVRAPLLDELLAEQAKIDEAAKAA